MVKKKTKQAKSNGSKAGMKKKSKALASANGVGPKIDPTWVERGSPRKEILPIAANFEQLDAAAKELAACHREGEELKAKRRDAMAGFKQTLNGIEERAAKAATTVEQQTVTAQITVREFLTRQNEMKVVREDTGEVVTSRPAYGSDLQEALSLEDDESEENDDADHDQADPTADAAP
jgi:hypothetical protein